MSLTSYRAAPPRGGGIEGWEGEVREAGWLGFAGLAATYSPAP
jgi:hypothetical protein